MNYDRELNKGMKVFSQLYVGLRPQSKDSVDLGFATPFEKGAAFEKRRKTVDEWCGGVDYVYDANGNIKRTKNGGYETVMRQPKIKMVDNKPRGGFKITDDVKRVYWGGGNVVWRVEDPEGFELEIQSQNLMAMIQVAGINEGGVIPGYCLWGRDGKNNILLHEKSEEYKNAILAAETLKKPGEISASVRQPGTKYLLQDGSEGIYLGQFWVCVDEPEEADALYQCISPVDGLVQKRVRKIGAPVAFDAVIINTMVRLYKKAPLVREIKVLPVLTRPEAAKVLEDAGSVSFAAASNKSRICYIHNEKPSKLQFVAKQISKKRFKDRLCHLTKRENSVFFRDSDMQSAASFHTFYGGYGADAAVLGFRVGDEMFSNEVTTSSYYRGTRYGLMFPMHVEGDILTEYYGDPYRFGQSHISITGSFQKDGPLIKAHELIKFGAFADLVQWYMDEYEAGNLVEIVAEAI